MLCRWIPFDHQLASIFSPRATMHFRWSRILFRLRLDFANLDITGIYTFPQPRLCAWIVTDFLVSASIQHYLRSFLHDLSHFQKWSDVLSREMHNVRVQGLQEHNSILLTFWTFCRSINRVHKWYVALTLILGIAAYIPIPILLSPVLLKWKYGYGILSILCWAAPAVGSLVPLFIPVLTPNPGFSPSYSTIRICESFQAQLLDSLCTWKATDPKDMSFRIHQSWKS